MEIDLSECLTSPGLWLFLGSGILLCSHLCDTKKAHKKADSPEWHSAAAVAVLRGSGAEVDFSCLELGFITWALTEKVWPRNISRIFQSIPGTRGYF